MATIPQGALWALAAVGVALTVIVGLTGQTTVNNVKDAGNRIATVTAARQATALTLRGDFARYRRFILEYSIEAGAAAIQAKQNVDVSHAAVIDGITTLQQGAAPAEAETLKELRAVLDQVQALYETKVSPLAERDNLSGNEYRTLGNIIQAEVWPIADKNTGLIKTLGDGYQAQMVSAIGASQAQAKSAVMRIWLFTIAGALLLFAFGYWLSRLVSGAIGRVRDSLVALSEGDLSRTVMVDSKDEIGAQRDNRSRTSRRHRRRHSIGGPGRELLERGHGPGPAGCERVVRPVLRAPHPGVAIPSLRSSAAHPYCRIARGVQLGSFSGCRGPG